MQCPGSNVDLVPQDLGEPILRAAHAPLGAHRGSLTAAR